MRSRRRAFRYFFVRAFSRGYVPTTSDVPGRCASTIVTFTNLQLLVYNSYRGPGRYPHPVRDITDS